MIKEGEDYYYVQTFRMPGGGYGQILDKEGLQEYNRFQFMKNLLRKKSRSRKGGNVHAWNASREERERTFAQVWGNAMQRLATAGNEETNQQP